jgi:hypothetical protein
MSKIRKYAMYAGSGTKSQVARVQKYLDFLSRKRPGTKVYISPREIWSSIELPDYTDIRVILGKSKDCKYEDGHLVSFAQSIWNSTHIVIFDDGLRKTQEFLQMSQRMSGIRNLRIVNTTVQQHHRKSNEHERKRYCSS